jgi:hypothetical protein
LPCGEVDFVVQLGIDLENELVESWLSRYGEER